MLVSFAMCSAIFSRSFLLCRKRNSLVMELTNISVTAYRSLKHENYLKCWTSKKERDLLHKILQSKHKTKRYVNINM